MIQLMDKNELKEWVDNWFVMNRYYHPYSTQTNIPVSELYDIVERIPTVDAIPVIRCKGCKHWDGYFCHNKWWGDGHGNYTPPIKTEEGYCDWAEGREHETD